MNKNDTGDKEKRGIVSIGAHGGFFEIRVKGHLDQTWSAWFEGMDVKLLDDEQMLLSGHIRDQAALMGILTRLYNLNLVLISVNEASRGN